VTAKARAMGRAKGTEMEKAMVKETVKVKETA
jgi:hypothetical protein